MSKRIQNRIYQVGTINFLNLDDSATRGKENNSGTYPLSKAKQPCYKQQKQAVNFKEMIVMLED